MNTKKLNIIANGSVENGYIRDLGAKVDLVEILYGGNTIRLSRSALVEFFGPRQDGSEDSSRDGGPRDSGPPDGHSTSPSPGSPELSGAVELEFEEDRDLESVDLNQDSAGYVRRSLH